MARQLPSLALLLAVFVALSNAVDWCSISCGYTGNFQEHTMCIYNQDQPAPRCNQVKKRDLDQSEIDIILQHHNKDRLSASDDLPPLVWDEALATVAQRWADQCEFYHDQCRNLEVDHHIGQNIAVNYSDNDAADLQPLLSSWSDEKRHVNTNIIASFPQDDATLFKVGHYTQIVWRKTTKIGCGFIAYRDSTTIADTRIPENYYVHFLVCNYDVGGNLAGAPVY